MLTHPEGLALLELVEAGNDALIGVLADWLEDHGHADAARGLRACQKTGLRPDKTTLTRNNKPVVEYIWRYEQVPYVVFDHLHRNFPTHSEYEKNFLQAYERLGKALLAVPLDRQTG